METDSDSELLRRFAETGDEEAFCRLVKRHAPMVRGVAVRCTGEAELAEEVTQTVFILLARKAGSVPPPHLAGWLHNTAFLTARNARRRAGRYRRALQQWSGHTAMVNSQLPLPGSAPWEDIRPHLDEALSRLPVKSRQPVILRYFENRSIREIAAVTGNNPDAIRKDLQRSVQRLGVLLRGRGIFTTGPTLAAILTGQNLCAPPASAAAIAAAALQAASSFKASAFFTQTIRFMAAAQTAKTTTAILVLVILLLLPALWFSLHGFHHGERIEVPTTAAAEPQKMDLPDGAPAGAKEKPEPEMKLARRGKLVQDRQTGHWKLSHADMEDYLQRHGRDGEALALAFLMTDEAEYLEEAIRSTENPSAALSFKCMSFPDEFTEAEMKKLADLLGPDNPYPDILRVFLEIKRGSPAALAGLSALRLDKPVYDPITPIPGRELLLLAETGSMSLSEALLNSCGGNSLNGRAFHVIGDELYQGAKRMAAGDSNSARAMLQQGVLLAKQQESRWDIGFGSLANSSEAAMLDIAKTLGITGVWEEPDEVVRQQLQNEELEYYALSETFAGAIPAMSGEALREWIPFAVSYGQTTMTRAMIQEEPLRSEYLKNEEKFRQNRLRLAAQTSGE